MHICSVWGLHQHFSFNGLKLYPTPLSVTKSQYLWGPACAAPSPGWSRWTSAFPWKPLRTSSSSWKWPLCERGRAERTSWRMRRRKMRGWARWGRRRTRPPVLLHPWRGSSDPPSPRRNAQRPPTPPCWGSSSLGGGRVKKWKKEKKIEKINSRDIDIFFSQKAGGYLLYISSLVKKCHFNIGCAKGCISD